MNQSFFERFGINERKSFDLSQFKKDFLNLWRRYQEAVEKGSSEGIISSYFSDEVIDGLESFIYHLEKQHITPPPENLDYKLLKIWIDFVQGRNISLKGESVNFEIPKELQSKMPEVISNLTKIANYLENLRLKEY